MASVRYLFVVSIGVILSTAFAQAGDGFVTVRGRDLIDPAGFPLMLRGINLGNWLVPEGYMFKLDSSSSPRMINGLFSELIGPDETRAFWKEFRDAYITREDIRIIKQLGLNSVRVPFNARLFMPEEFDGVSSEDPFVYLDRVVAWCHEAGLLVVLDMHCAPGGQTGDNIDDSWGYPYLFESAASQDRTVALWRKIARRYASEPAVLGYDLLNEPIAHYFDIATLNPLLEPLYKRIVAAIRTVDTNHVVFLGGAQWDSNFSVFGPLFDGKVVYTFHKYWSDTTQAVIQEYADFRAARDVPVWLGESGENTNAWIDSFRRLLDRNGIGWCFWPFKRMDAGRCVVTFAKPPGWDVVQRYDRERGTGYASMRTKRPDPAIVRAALKDLLHQIRSENCRPNPGYIGALGCDLPGNGKKE
jgi:aryl-phospho-beta-D-glucosidase BglC (GH1 family)